MTAQDGAATERTDGAPGSPSGRQLAVFGGGADRLDDVLTRAVVPAVREALRTGAVAGWSFVREADRRGPHLRIDLDGDGSGLAAELERTVPAAARAAEPSDTLLPRPASQRSARALVGVVAEDGGGPTLADRLSSEVAATALPHIGDAKERSAFALALLRSLGRDAAFWDSAARVWVGDDESAERLLGRLGQIGDRLGQRLEREAARQGERPELKAAIESWADAVRGADGINSTREAHLICNRLGVTPIEEALLAMLLAREPGGGATVGAEAAVEVRGVTKEDRGGDAVLDDISLEVAAGETLAVLGPEGAGKSSLLGVLAGLRLTDGGAVRVLGHDPRRDREALAGEVGMPLPDEELPRESTVRACLETEVRVQGTGDADRLLQAAALVDLASAQVDDLDPGARRRLSIATALVADPAVLLLDAPAWELSPVERDDIWRFVRELRGSGKTIVIATTSLEEARALADRAALLVAGEIAFLGDPEELTRDLFPERTVTFKTVEQPDRSAIEDLPEAIGVRLQQEADHWSVEARARQPDELLRMLGADPGFPEIVEVGSRDLYSTFAQPQRRG